MKHTASDDIQAGRLRSPHLHLAPRSMEIHDVMLYLALSIVALVGFVVTVQGLRIRHSDQRHGNRFRLW